MPVVRARCDRPERGERTLRRVPEPLGCHDLLRHPVEVPHDIRLGTQWDSSERSSPGRYPRFSMTEARTRFDGNCQDIDRLLQIHADFGGSDVGRRHGLEVLNKSAIVLLTAVWEAYCEDVAEEAVNLIVDKVASADQLPVDLKRHISKKLDGNNHELAAWRLADGGWRIVVRTNLDEYLASRTGRLNTPRAQNIDEMFKRTLGMDQISKCWKWSRVNNHRAVEKLDLLVTLRGSIAHRGSGSEGVYLRHVRSYYDHVKQLVAKTDPEVESFIAEFT